MKYTLCDHPLVQHKLAFLRDKTTASKQFRILLEEVGLLMGMHVLSELPTSAAKIDTPLKQASVRVVDQSVILVAVLRAGLGFLPGLLRIAPDAKIGHIGLYRHEETLHPVRYYVRLPKEVDRGFTVLLDPMLATGGSAVEAIRILKTAGASKIALVSLVAARQGIRKVNSEHPDVRIFTAAVDPVLNESGYIVPGLGDAGDRLFGT